MAIYTTDVYKEEHWYCTGTDMLVLPQSNVDRVMHLAYSHPLAPTLKQKPGIEIL